MIAGSDLLPQEQKLLTFAPLTDKIVFMSIEVPKYITDLSPEERKKLLEKMTPISSSIVEYEDDDSDPWSTLYELSEPVIKAFGKAAAAHQHNSNPIIPRKEDSYTVEILYPCHSCLKPIRATDDYCSIHHYKVRGFDKSRHLHFHESCFEEIAGKEYM